MSRRDAKARQRDAERRKQRRLANQARFGVQEPLRLPGARPARLRTYDPDDYAHPDSDVRRGP